MIRRLRELSVAALVLLAFCQQAEADEASRAEELNDEGKKRIRQLDLEGAAERFRQAIALTDDPRFHFNLCYTLEKSGQLAQAREACDSALGSGKPNLEKKAKALAAKIDEKLGPRPSLPDPEPPPSGSSGQGQGAAGVPPPPPPPEKPPEEGPKVAYGVVAGASLASYSGVSSVEQVVGIAAGGWILLPLANGYEFVLDGQYVQRGGEFSDTGLGRVSIHTAYLDVGAAFRYRMLRGMGALSYYFDAGVVASFLLGDSREVDGVSVSGEDLNAKDLASVFALGGVIDTAGGAIDLRLRYMLGYLAVNKERGGPGVFDPKILNRTFLLQGGYWF